MNISDFVSQISGAGLARTNRYTVEMVLPATRYGAREYSKMLLLCESLQLPGLNVNTAQIRTFGEIREMPYEFNYDPVTMSFYVDGDMVIKGIFDEWIQSIQRGDTRNFNYYENYISDQVKIYVEDLNDESKYVVTLYECYPKTVTPVQMGYDQKDVMKLNVSLVYKYWRSEVVSKTQTSGVAQTYTPTTDYVIPESLGDTTTVTNFNVGNPMGDVSGWGNGW